jgi:hypothetical protein
MAVHLASVLLIGRVQHRDTASRELTDELNSRTMRRIGWQPAHALNRLWAGNAARRAAAAE